LYAFIDDRSMEDALAPVRTEPTAHDLYTGRDPKRVKVFDTTLRDGEQSPGCTMTGEEKLQVSPISVELCILPATNPHT
jgi:hypothetical protein